MVPKVCPITNVLASRSRFAAQCLARTKRTSRSVRCNTPTASRNVLPAPSPSFSSAAVAALSNSLINLKQFGSSLPSLSFLQSPNGSLKLTGSPPAKP
jgi:hypothetical protein